MKRAKYENVVGLVALILKHATSSVSFTAQNMSKICQIWKGKTFGNLNEISYLQVSWLSSKVKKKDIIV